MHNDHGPMLYAGTAAKRLRGFARTLKQRMAAGANAKDSESSLEECRFVMAIADALDELQNQRAAAEGRDIGAYDHESGETIAILSGSGDARLIPPDDFSGMTTEELMAEYERSRDRLVRSLDERDAREGEARKGRQPGD
jgi:hypothetical protein